MGNIDLRQGNIVAYVKKKKRSAVRLGAGLVAIVAQLRTWRLYNTRMDGGHLLTYIMKRSALFVNFAGV